MNPEEKGLHSVFGLVICMDNFKNERQLRIKRKTLNQIKNLALTLIYPKNIPSS